ncbi:MULTISPECIES: RelA/SpoT domain-containing protein [unclassified Acinetobacter]|uniref:RelA/SpoT domain-containing protein n=1 Tax=unclassified Acinetobacter TaxID=196816 RepID=UPI0015D27D03|nr:MULTISPECIES: RelA/SpoT domain-containing protein [unclassified Acinetobacter]UUS56800.1 RelA/SpoT domain-containing protein [Acinetobacter sp. YH16040_T]
MKYTGKRITQAGNDLQNPLLKENPVLFRATMDVLTYWRYSHESSMNSAEVLLKEATVKFDKSAFLAKRLKRSNSIIKKLSRFDNMMLKNMQDIGGVRVVVSSSKKLQKILKQIQSDKRFYNNENKLRKKDYLKNPKPDGYRGVHLVGKFLNDEKENRNIELQLRTQMQHTWATTLEIVDLFTKQNLKTNQGRMSWQRFFMLVSNQLAIIESLPGYGIKNEKDLMREYILYVFKDEKLLREVAEIKYISKKLQVPQLLNSFARSINIMDQSERLENCPDGYILVRLNTNTKSIQCDYFKKEEAEKASEYYTLLESTIQEGSNWIVALVSSNAVDGIKQAYPNYFADSRNFLTFLGFIHLIKAQYVEREPVVS